MPEADWHGSSLYIEEPARGGEGEGKRGKESGREMTAESERCGGRARERAFKAVSPSWC